MALCTCMCILLYHKHMKMQSGVRSLLTRLHLLLTSVSLRGSWRMR